MLTKTGNYINSCPGLLIHGLTQPFNKVYKMKVSSLRTITIFSKTLIPLGKHIALEFKPKICTAMANGQMKNVIHIWPNSSLREMWNQHLCLIKKCSTSFQKTLNNALILELWFHLTKSAPHSAKLSATHTATAPFSHVILSQDTVTSTRWTLQNHVPLGTRCSQIFKPENSPNQKDPVLRVKTNPESSKEEEPKIFV